VRNRRKGVMSRKVVAIVGSYRRGGAIDSAVEAVLEGARRRRAETHTIYLSEQHVEFCTNCRQCTQSPGPGRGKCVQQDDLDKIVTEIEMADAVVLATPVNCYNATAVFRQFMERLIGCAYWPWRMPAPRARSKVKTLRAALIASSAMPGFLIPLCTGTAKALRVTAGMLGARPVGKLWIGLAAAEPLHLLSPRTLKRARRLGMKLV
jgi:hypothetical protein